MVPLPLKLLSVPPVTDTLPAVSTPGSLRVKVSTTLWPAGTELLLLAMVTVGGVVSSV